MSLWIRFARAIRLPGVLGSRPNSKFGNERKAIVAFVKEAQTNRVYARYANGTPHVDADIEVDIKSASVSHQPHDSVAR